MNHEIDLSKFQTRCDLIRDAIEKNKIKGLKNKKRIYDDIIVEEVLINSNFVSELNKERGIYITINFNDVTDSVNRNNLVNVFSIELEKKALIIGLGNNLSTPDSLGPKTIRNIVVTRHLFNLENIQQSEGFSNVSILEPNVYASTGVESFEVIKGVVDRTKPDFLIVIDSLASSSLENINKILQITDTGIEPGSGIGNNQKEISQKTLLIPVIAIGIPTVVDAATIVNDTINFLIKKISYNIMNIDNPKEKLSISNSFNYLNSDYVLDDDERKLYLGLLGELNDKEMKNLLNEVLTPIGYNFIVTPKEIDFVIDKLSFVLSSAINNVLHENLRKNYK